MSPLTVASVFILATIVSSQEYGEESDGECRFGGQFLVNPSDECSYSVCGFAPGASLKAGEIQFRPMNQRCPPGLSTNLKKFSVHNPCSEKSDKCSVKKGARNATLYGASDFDLEEFKQSYTPQTFDYRPPVRDESQAYVEPADYKPAVNFASQTYTANDYKPARGYGRQTYRDGEDEPQQNYVSQSYVAAEYKPQQNYLSQAYDADEYKPSRNYAAQSYDYKAPASQTYEANGYRPHGSQTYGVQEYNPSRNYVRQPYVAEGYNQRPHGRQDQPRGYSAPGGNAARSYKAEEYSEYKSTVRSDNQPASYQPQGYQDQQTYSSNFEIPSVPDKVRGSSEEGHSSPSYPAPQYTTPSYPRPTSSYESVNVFHGRQFGLGPNMKELIYGST